VAPFGDSDGGEDVGERPRPTIEESPAVAPKLAEGGEEIGRSRTLLDEERRWGIGLKISISIKLTITYEYTMC
jgi:hypothetical protein